MGLNANKTKSQLVSELEAAQARCAQLEDRCKQYDDIQKRLHELELKVEKQVEERNSELVVENEQLRREILHREGLNHELLDASRHAGMAEVATSVLHNVGNILNSVSISTMLMTDWVESSKTRGLAKAVTLLTEHLKDVAYYLVEDDRGRKLPEYLTKVSDQLNGERDKLLTELQGLNTNVKHIKDIVTMQQQLASTFGVVEEVRVKGLVEDAFKLYQNRFLKLSIKVSWDDVGGMKIVADRHKVLQILVNLVKNATEALTEKPGEKIISLTIHRSKDGFVRFEVYDSGVGIEEKDLANIFSFGYTTKSSGHGFGLHNCANIAREMGGNLKAFSDGPGMGATFVLELPVVPRLNYGSD